MRVAAIAALASFPAIAAPGATQVRGQDSPAPAFEVASVKASSPDSTNPLSAFPMISPAPGRRFTASNATLRVLVLTAYELQDFQLIGGRSSGQVLVIDSADLPIPD